MYHTQVRVFDYIGQSSKHPDIPDQYYTSSGIRGKDLVVLSSEGKALFREDLVQAFCDSTEKTLSIVYSGHADMPDMSLDTRVSTDRVEVQLRVVKYDDQMATIGEFAIILSMCLGELPLIQDSEINDSDEAVRLPPARFIQDLSRRMAHFAHLAITDRKVKYGPFFSKYPQYGSDDAKVEIKYMILVGLTQAFVNASQAAAAEGDVKSAIH